MSRETRSEFDANQALSDVAFQADIDKVLHRVEWKAKQTARSFEALQNPNYWKEQQARINNPTAKSYDLIASLIKV